MRRWWAYPSVVVATAAVVSLRYAHDEADDTHHNFLLPIMVAGWVGGARCCAFATALNAALMTFLFTAPRYNFRIDSSADAARLGLYLCMCASSASSPKLDNVPGNRSNSVWPSPTVDGLNWNPRSPIGWPPRSSFSPASAVIGP